LLPTDFGIDHNTFKVNYTKKTYLSDRLFKRNDDILSHITAVHICAGGLYSVRDGKR
jgi:hypothetical protein